MKKILNILLLAPIITTTSMITVSCAIGETSSHKFLSSLKDFDWSSSQGFNLNYYNADSKHKLSDKQIANFNFSQLDKNINVNYNGFFLIMIFLILILKKTLH